MVPDAIVPTLMYRSPVADSMDRLRAVWIAAQQTMSGNTIPTMSRSQTNSAHEPVSALKPAVPDGPRPTAVDPTKRANWAATIQVRTREKRMSGAFAQPGRDEIPVAKDHRGEHAARRAGQEGQLHEQGNRSTSRPAPTDGSCSKCDEARRQTTESEHASPPVTPDRNNECDREHGEDHERRPSDVGPADVADEQSTAPWQGVVGENGKDGQESGAEGREAKVAAGRIRSKSTEDHRSERPDGEARKHRPVDVGEVLGDPFGGHQPSVRWPRR